MPRPRLRPRGSPTDSLRLPAAGAWSSLTGQYRPTLRETSRGRSSSGLHCAACGSAPAYSSPSSRSARPRELVSRRQRPWRSSTTRGTGRPGRTAPTSTGTRTAMLRRATLRPRSILRVGSTRRATRRCSTDGFANRPRRYRRDRDVVVGEGFGRGRTAARGDPSCARARRHRGCAPRAVRRSNNRRHRARHCVPADAGDPRLLRLPRDRLPRDRLAGAHGDALGCPAVRADAARRLCEDGGFPGRLHVRHPHLPRPNGSRGCATRRTGNTCSARRPIGPGYSARRATGDARILARRGGNTYDAMWRAALRAHADVATITSYNE